MVSLGTYYTGCYSTIGHKVDMHSLMNLLLNISMLPLLSIHTDHSHVPKLLANSRLRSNTFLFRGSNLVPSGYNTSQSYAGKKRMMSRREEGRRS